VASQQLTHMNELYASIEERISKPDIDLATRRDIAENLHLAAIEPEAVTYAEVDADGVRHCGASRRAATRTTSCCTATLAAPSSRRCTPTERPLGTSPRWSAPAPSYWITGVHRNTSSALNSMMWRRRVAGSSPKDFARKALPASVTFYWRQPCREPGCDVT
jgi:hypothetical protein